MPIDACFDLIGSVGVGTVKLKTTNNGAGIFAGNSHSKAGFRLGAGAQYKFDDNFAVRAMLHYHRANVKGSDMKVLKSASSLNLGLTYTI